MFHCEREPTAHELQSGLQPAPPWKPLLAAAWVAQIADFAAPLWLSSTYVP